MSAAALTFPQAIAKLREVFPTCDYSERLGHGCHRTIAEAAMKQLPRGSRILDFGAGPGDKAVLLSLLGYSVEACDDLADEWHLRPGQRESIVSFCGAHGVPYTILDRATPWPWTPDKPFDAVMLCDVLEHLHDSPRELMTSLMALVRPGGLLMVTVPNAGNLKKRVELLLGRTNLPDYGVFFWNKGSWRGHVREHVRGDLAALASFLELDVLELRGVHHMLETLPSAAVPVWKVLTGIVPGWRDSWLLVARKR
jgi:SAM-dependent methyltransferase